MRKVIAVTALACGLLIILIPRYILPSCEYEGYAHMHCSDTARAEFFAGATLMAAGAGIGIFKQRGVMIAGATAAIILYAASFRLPDLFGYCQSPRMPCHYGMVPGVRFVSGIGFLITLGAVITEVRSLRTKNNEHHSR